MSPTAHVVTEVGVEWSAQRNDYIGGYMVTDYPWSATLHDLRFDGEKEKRGYNIAECMREEDARMIAALLNEAGITPRSIREQLSDFWELS